MEYVLGIDLGTSYFKLGVFDKTGTLCGLGRVAVEKDTGDGTLCELPTERFWELLKTGLTRACKQAKVEPVNIKALSYSSQVNTFLLLDENDKPITPLVLWPDMESTAKSLDDLVNQLYGKEKPNQIVATGGGAKSDLWLQIKSDLIGAKLIKADCEEPACKGAAMLAANW